MKKTLIIIAMLCVALTTLTASPKHEFRATWLTTVSRIDWPETNTADEQKAEITTLFDQLAANNINAVFFQVRGRSDAFYTSNYEPWASELTGTLDTDPGYDPLQFAIEEAHKRGMELHAWINPFRLSSSSANRLTEAQVKSLYKAPSGKTELQWSWVLPYDNGEFTGQIIDPGNPNAREYVVNVIMDIVNRYNIDGIVMDDYFYPYGGTTNEDATSKAAYKPNNVIDQDKDGNTDDDWRRSNVDSVISTLSERIAAVNALKTAGKPNVRFGMGPGGIWTMQSKAANAYDIQLPNNIVGSDPYEHLGCNTVEWIKQGWVDYVCPQIYWSTEAEKQDYDVLCAWWAKDVCEHFSNQLTGDQRVHFYPSHAASKVYKLDAGKRYEGFGNNEAEGILEIIKQVESNRQHLSSGYTGSVFFSNKDFLAMSSELKAACYPQKALVPPMAWKSTETLDAPHTLRINGKTLTWTHAKAERFTVYIYPKNVHISRAFEEPYYFQGVVYGKSFTLPNTFNATTHHVAVCAYDRYGVEHTPAEYGPEVTYVLNGGRIVQKEVLIVPETNEDLWGKDTADTKGFMHYFNHTRGIKRATQPIENSATFWTSGNDPNALTLTSDTSRYKWLGDYILSVATQQSYTINTEALWRWHLWAFLNKTQRTSSPNTANFTEAGKPEKWKNAYLAAHGLMNFPTQPTQEQLCASFIARYKEYFSYTNTSSYTCSTISNFLYAGNTAGHDVSTMMTNANSGWKWLGDYIKTIAGTPNATKPEWWWRANLIAFFTTTKEQNIGYGDGKQTSADFSTAGQPSAWESAWRAVNPGTPIEPEILDYTLPGFIVESALILPTNESRPVYIYHPDNYVFIGWVNEAGETITELPIGYKGIVYAQWQGPIQWVLNGGVFTGHDHLPMAVTQTYTLPTARNMHKEGYKFKGWYNNASYTGEEIKTIPENYSGTLYAKWEEGIPVTWHLGADMNITNEDLWELFMIDYNTFYKSDILGENRSTENRAYQAITGAFGFMHSGEDKFKTGGRAMDFMEHEASPWKWLGDYIIETLDAENKKLESNAPLWTSFKEATGLTHLGALKDVTVGQICSKNALYSNSTDEGKTISDINDDGSSDASILTALFEQEEWKWLKTYIKNHATTELKDNIATSYGDRRAWAYAVALFFKQESRATWPVTADFTTAGKHSVWKEHIPEQYHDLGHFRITTEVEWRKTIHAFFNHTNILTYTLNSETKTEGTADFREKGLPKPANNPDGGWYNDWWNGNFPAYLINNEPLPHLLRNRYIFAGWHYGTENGFMLNESYRANGTYNANDDNTYRNHLWARWLEMCLYEGYVDPDPFAMDENGYIEGQVNNNYDLVKYIAEESQKSGLPHYIDIVRPLVGGMYNTMFLPFGINGVGGKIDGVNVPGKQYYLAQVVDDDGNQLLPPETTSILVYDGCKIIKEGSEDMLVFNFHEYASTNPNETLMAKQPFLIKPARDVTARMHIWKANMSDPFNPNKRPDFSGTAKFQGIYEPTILGDIPEQENHLMLVANNRLAQVNSQGEMLGLRAYFRIPKTTPKGIKSVIRIQNGPTSIEQIELTLPTLRKILHLGQIYILRGDEVYDLMGNRVR